MGASLKETGEFKNVEVDLNRTTQHHPIQGHVARLALNVFKGAHVQQP